MIWKDYSQLRAKHAFLSPSRYAWLNYDTEKLVRTYKNQERVRLGTQYHKLAEDLIRLAVRVKDTEASFNAFVNDAIGYRMEPEAVLFYSRNCFGTADAISYDESAGRLRIHDLKTGVSPGSIHQLMIYAGLFVLDYDVVPAEVILRIYQSSEVVEHIPTTEAVKGVADQIIAADRIIESITKDR